MSLLIARLRVGPAATAGRLEDQCHTTERAAKAGSAKPPVSAQRVDDVHVAFRCPHQYNEVTRLPVQNRGWRQDPDRLRTQRDAPGSQTMGSRQADKTRRRCAFVRGDAKAPSDLLHGNVVAQQVLENHGESSGSALAGANLTDDADVLSLQDEPPVVASLIRSPSREGSRPNGGVDAPSPFWHKRLSGVVQTCGGAVNMATVGRVDVPSFLHGTRPHRRCEYNGGARTNRRFSPWAKRADTLQ